ncbi:hypothetical protein N7454_010760 [Penicillium verhagenii]|nr:hypothetical protein N7454_010760 [Penicillium verhagenii]
MDQTPNAMSEAWFEDNITPRIQELISSPPGILLPAQPDIPALILEIFQSIRNSLLQWARSEAVNPNDSSLWPETHPAISKFLAVIENCTPEQRNLSNINSDLISKDFLLNVCADLSLGVTKIESSLRSTFEQSSGRPSSRFWKFWKYWWQLRWLCWKSHIYRQLRKGSQTAKGDIIQEETKIEKIEFSNEQIDKEFATSLKKLQAIYEQLRRLYYLLLQYKMAKFDARLWEFNQDRDSMLWGRQMLKL